MMVVHVSVMAEVLERCAKRERIFHIR